MPRNARFLSRVKQRKGRTPSAIKLVQSNDIRMVEKVERLHDEVQFPMLAIFEEFQCSMRVIELLDSNPPWVLAAILSNDFSSEPYSL